MNYKELSIIAENLANLYEDGIPIDMSFELLSELHISKSYKKSLKVIKEKILKGNSLADGFREYSNLYPNFFIGIISLGESSGELGKCLENIGKYFCQINDVKQKLKSELRYPVFILLTFILFTICSFFLIIPNIYEAFSSISSKIPKVIEVCYFASSWILENIMISFIALIFWSIAIVLVIKHLSGAINKDFTRVLLKINFIREYYEYIFVLLLSVIYSSGIQLTKGIELCINSTDIVVIKNVLIKINEEILKGNEISEGVKDSKFLSKYTCSMIGLGEKSGNLSSILQKIESRLESSISEKLKNIVSIISPISIGIIATLILIFIIIFIMPMVDMIYSGYV
ncbi:type II secretion system F family protein [Clostridium sp. SHJSY1]|uniref:type II secretion system F family protein n=1 Tax=Clostridium sp. SHJSY1 TaxID=2942483 RepID=UPI0028762559|nr:type II secretion system F family protein [Clostridium sp. SHJSY1]MDS0527319.1 type II secretion system F family protein [Clostridium sp. SHJSY1]